MHSVVINKVEIRTIGEQNFTTLEIVPESGIMTEDTQDTPQGNLEKISTQFNIANVTVEMDALMKKFCGPKLQLRLTDTNSLVHMVGDDYYYARMKRQKIIDKTPGSFNGYRCTVSCNSPSGSSVS